MENLHCGEHVQNLKEFDIVLLPSVPFVALSRKERKVRCHEKNTYSCVSEIGQTILKCFEDCHWISITAIVTNILKVTIPVL